MSSKYLQGMYFPGINTIDHETGHMKKNLSYFQTQK